MLGGGGLGEILSHVCTHNVWAPSCFVIDLRTQESVGSGGEQKLVCSGRRTEERYRVDGPTNDTVTGSRDETVKQTQLTRSSRK